MQTFIVNSKLTNSPMDLHPFDKLTYGYITTDKWTYGLESF